MGSEKIDFAGGFEDLTGIDIGGVSKADKALDQQQRSAQDANNLQREMYNQQRKDNAPWLDAGKKAIGGMQDADFQKDFTLGDFQKDPGFDFRMKEGAKALEGSASARGSLHSGATLKALSRYGQDFASNEFNNAYNRFNADRDRRFNRLASLSGSGQTATGQMGQAGQNYAGQVGNNMMDSANAGAAHAISQGNRVSDLIGTGIGLLGGASKPNPNGNSAGLFNTKFSNLV